MNLKLLASSRLRSGVSPLGDVFKVKIEKEWFLKTRAFLDFFRSKIEVNDLIGNKSELLNKFAKIERIILEIESVPVNCRNSYGSDQCFTRIAFKNLFGRDLQILKLLLDQERIISCSFFSEFLRVFEAEYQLMIHTKKAEKQMNIA